MPVQVRYYTDPACIWSWGAEPKLRRLMWDFDGELEFVWVMGGLARSYGPSYRDEEGRIGSGPDCNADLMSHWLDVAAETGMPCDPRLWTERPISGTFPACVAVAAAREQGWRAGYAYLRALREGLMFERRRLDNDEALTELAAETAGVDVDDFAEALASGRAAAAFEADLEEVHDIPEEAREAGKTKKTEGRERLSFPSAVFVGEDGSRHGVWGWAPLEDYREAALAAGARRSNTEPLAPREAIERFGRLGTREAEALAEAEGPGTCAELWRLAAAGEISPRRALTGTMWEPA